MWMSGIQRTLWIRRVPRNVAACSDVKGGTVRAGLPSELQMVGEQTVQTSCPADRYTPSLLGARCRRLPFAAG